jgi:hypothetical protein
MTCSCGRCWDGSGKVRGHQTAGPGHGIRGLAAGRLALAESASRWIDGRGFRANRALRAHWLGRAYSKKAESEIAIPCARLVSEYPESFEARCARTAFDPDRAVRIGRPVPAFSWHPGTRPSRTRTSP